MRAMEMAKRLHQARRERWAMATLTSEWPELDLNGAYEIQRAALELALGEGEALSGYKMGLTSRAKQRDVSVHEPIRGFLLASMETPKGDRVETATRIHPRVEPEVAVVLAKRIAGPRCTLQQVCQALAAVVPAVEILDSRYENFSFKLADVIADNTSASGYILGGLELGDRLGDLPLLGVTVKKNGEIVETGAPAAVMGNPLLSVVALANMLAQENVALEPGMVVLTGGITGSIPVKAGDLVEIVWPGETMSLRIS